METVFIFLFTLLLMVAVAYAHGSLALLVPRRRDVLLARGVLIFTGLAFGAVMAWRGTHWPVEEGVSPVLVFASAFGITHVPAALILWLKRLARRQT